MKTVTLCELLNLSIDNRLRPVRAWMLSRRIEILNMEREISKASIEREQLRQKRIDKAQVMMRADLALLKRQ